MRSKIVTRYYCDFCKKANLQKRAMEKHEKRCTLNPNRECRMCDFNGGGHGKDMAELIALLPNSTDYHSGNWITEEFYSEFLKSVEDAMPALREATQNCPVCIMAALRQAKIPVPMVSSFNFTEEASSIFSDHADENQTYASYYG